MVTKYNTESTSFIAEFSVHNNFINLKTVFK